MKNSIDELINDINQATFTEIRIIIHTGSEVIIQSFHYTNLKIDKDEKGTIALGNYANKEGYIITDKHEISKSENNNGKISYHISDKGIPLVDIYMNN